MLHTASIAMDSPIKNEEPAIVPISSQSSFDGFQSRQDPQVFNVIDLDRVGETQGYILDEEKLRAQLDLPANAILKKTRDGKHVLIPQPSDDPEDPLNWPEWKKHLILLVIAVGACSADYSAATGASALIPQAKEWRVSSNTVNHATAG